MDRLQVVLVGVRFSNTGHSISVLCDLPPVNSLIPVNDGAELEQVIHDLKAQGFEVTEIEDNPDGRGFMMFLTRLLTPFDQHLMVGQALILAREGLAHG